MQMDGKAHRHPIHHGNPRLDRTCRVHQPRPSRLCHGRVKIDLIELQISGPKGKEGVAVRGGEVNYHPRCMPSPPHLAKGHSPKIHPDRMMV
jgi:hypothetical protein